MITQVEDFLFVRALFFSFFVDAYMIGCRFFFQGPFFLYVRCVGEEEICLPVSAGNHFEEEEKRGRRVRAL